MADSSDPIAEALARLVSEAELVDEGGFRVDGEAARRKLAERQLADPDAWLLLVLEAAEVIGSLRVEIIDLFVGVRVRLIGSGANELAPPASLERLFDWMFDEVESLPPVERRRGRARQLFAYAINAASTSGEHERRVALRARSPEAGRSMSLIGQQPPQVKTGRRGEPRLDIDVLDAGNMQRWRITRPESALVVARAGYGQWPIHLAGRPLPPQPRLGQRRVDMPLELEGEQIGFAALLHARCQPRLVLVANGVELETEALLGHSLGFYAQVSDAFTRDLSLGRAVRDARFEAIMRCVNEAHEQLCAQQQATPNTAALQLWSGEGGLQPVQVAKVKIPRASLWEVFAFPLGGFALAGLAWGISAELWVLGLLCCVLIYFSGAQILRYLRQRKLFGGILDFDGALDETIRAIEQNRRRARR